jgi:hypothetical protein
MKTTKEWIDTLPQDIKERAYNHTENDRLENLEPSLSEAIFGAFVWSEKPEGHKFWYLVSRGEFDQAMAWLNNTTKP